MSASYRTIYQQAAHHTSQLGVVEPPPSLWDAFVRQQPQSHLLQACFWGDLKASFGWEARRVVVMGRASGADSAPHPQHTHMPHTPSDFVRAGAQMLLRHRYGLCMAYVPRGPLLSGDDVIDDLLLAGLERAARRQRAVFLRFEPNLLEADPRAMEVHSWLLRQGFEPTDPIQPRSTIHVDLRPAPAELLAACSKGHRADIRRAERQGVTVRVGDSADIACFYAIMQSTGQRAAFAIHSESYYRLAWQLFQPRSRLLLAEHDGEVVAAHLVLADTHCGAYLYSGATDAGLKAGANHLLQWHALQWAREQGCTCYDLWGIPDALGEAATSDDETQRAALHEAAQADPLIGVYRFKKGFGGRVVRYLPAYDRVFLPPFYRLWRRRFGSSSSWAS